MSDKPPRTLLLVVRGAMRVRHYSLHTQKAYLGWIRRIIRFHGRRHPRELGAPEIAAFGPTHPLTADWAPATVQ